jgi:hypothetical protein
MPGYACAGCPNSWAVTDQEAIPARRIQGERGQADQVRLAPPQRGLTVAGSL